MTQTALITGAAKRIGKEISLCLAAKGYDIALHYNQSDDEAIMLQQKIITMGRKCDIFKCDFSDKSACEDLIFRVSSSMENLKLLVNSASIFKGAALIESSAEIFDEHFAVNFRTPFILSRDFAAVAKEGHIINILDTRIDKNKSRYFAYTLSKKSLRDLTKLSASELAPAIRVNAIAPGYILPPLKDGEPWPKEKKIPLKLKGKPESLLRGLTYLLDNDFVTGEVLYIDGGEHL